MKDTFVLNFDTMPKGTSQEKRINRKTGAFFKNTKCQAAEWLFLTALRPHRPPEPSERPVKLYVWLTFDVKDKSLWGKYKPTKPDTDNYIKLFKDCMTKAGFWRDDSQVVDERIIKTYAEKATIFVRWSELGDKPNEE